MGQGLILAKGNVGRSVDIHGGRKCTDQDSSALGFGVLVAGYTVFSDGMADLDQG